MKKSIGNNLRLRLRQVQTSSLRLRDKAQLWLRPRWGKLHAHWLPWQRKLQAAWLPLQEKWQAWVTPHREKFQARWQSLNQREQYTLFSGALAAALLLFYALIWSPLTFHLNDLRQQITTEKKTAVWIQEADKQLRVLEERQSQVTTKQLSKRLNAVQEDLRQAPLGKNLKQLSQSGTDEIRVVFNPVQFDEWISWVLDFSQQHHLTVKQAAVKRLNGVGLVQAEFVFQVDGSL